MRSVARAVLLLTAILFLGLGVASARVGPPAEVQLLGPPRPAVAGEIYSGRLLITCGEDINLDNFRFDGKGWQQVSLDIPNDLFLAKDASITVDFSVESDDPGEVLVFVYEWNETIIRQSFDLSREAWMRTTTPTPTVMFPGSDREFPPSPDTGHTVFAPTHPIVPWNDGARLKPGSCDVGHVGDQPGEDEAAGEAKEYTLTVSGRFVCLRSDGEVVPADGMLVEIYDADPGIDDLLWTTTTLASGYFSQTFHDTQSEDPDIYVIFRTQNAEVETEDPTWHQRYAFETGEWANVTASNLNVGTHTTSDESLHRAIFAHTNVTRTARWYQNLGYDCTDVDVRWPCDAGDTRYWAAGDIIYIGRDASWRENSYSHEYGHHFHDQYTGLETPAYCNGFCDPSGLDCSHCIWCRENMTIAWQEGVADWSGNVIPKSYLEDYGLAPLSFTEVDGLNTCQEDLTYHNPNQTEGYVAALLVDIQDSDFDDHDEYPDVWDEMSFGPSSILECIAEDDPGTVLGFLEDYRSRYPGSRELLWATAMNCGYQTDDSSPLPPAGLTSASHVVGVASTNAIVEMQWTRAIDDASGIQGYSVVFSAGGPMLPDTVMDIEDDIDYAYGPLGAASWYFNIRTLDRDGNWSGDYASCGPIIVREPDPVNYNYFVAGGWQYEVVPSSEAASGYSDAIVSATLPGEAVGTYWNVSAQNDGEEAAAEDLIVAIHIDDVEKGRTSWAPPWAGEYLRANNKGPILSYGGRHTLHCELDPDHTTAEPDEDDNFWGRQFVWTPLEMAEETLYSRPAPSRVSAGYGRITSGPAYFTCHGYRLDPSGWWNAVSLWAVDNAEDFDQRLHEPSSGAEDGFDSYVATSARLAGCLDAVLVNRNTAGGEPWDVSVMNFVGTATHQYLTRHTVSEACSYGDSLTVTLPADEYILLREFYAGLNDTGATSVFVRTDPPTTHLFVQWRANDYVHGSLLECDAEAVTDAGGVAHLPFSISSTGYNCLVFYRDPKDGNEAVDITFEIQSMPPDFKPFSRVGWHSQLVPRSTADGTETSVALPDTLHGNIDSTYYNLTFWNWSPGSCDELYSHILIDGEVATTLFYPGFSGFEAEFTNLPFGRTVRGGRHSLVHWIDYENFVEEIDETNNTYGEQYVWSPMALGPHQTLTRAAPPDPTGSWTRIASGEPLWYNCDGLRVDVNNSYWLALAVMPGDTSDVDIRVHQPLSGAKNGFAENEAVSSWGIGQSDYVLLNFNILDRHDYDAGVINISGQQDYVAQCIDEQWLGQPDGTYGPFDSAAGEIVQVYEMGLQLGTFDFQLNNLAGSVDWGMCLHPADEGFQWKSLALNECAAWLNGPGTGEGFSAVIDTAGYYCLTVWKRYASDLDQTGEYELVIGPDVSAVGFEDGIPLATSLQNPYPNPFNPQTTVTFDLAATGLVDVAVYDLTGARVRTLTRDVHPAGRHSVIWDGRNDAGLPLASGVYLVRMKSAEVKKARKIVLAK